jgi:hypothetical protein
MVQNNHSIDELRRASNRVFYEYWMLDELADALIQDLPVVKKKTPDDFISSFNSTGVTKVAYINRASNIVTNNARIEAFGVHVRALLDFFYGLEELERKKRKPQKDDVFAEEFFDKPEDWRKTRPSIPVDFVEIREKVNKQIAHITVEGLQMDPKTKQWLFGYLKDIIRPMYEKFQEQALKERLGERWNWLR